jgi:two-component system response regulator YesN
MYVFENYQKNCNVNDLINNLNVSRSHFMRLFKKETGDTFNSFLTKHRIKTATDLINTRQFKIYEICNYVGYNDVAYFSNLYKKLTGQRPSDLLMKED